jgi:hypothetical protein
MQMHPSFFRGEPRGAALCRRCGPRGTSPAASLIALARALPLNREGVGSMRSGLGRKR